MTRRTRPMFTRLAVVLLASVCATLPTSRAVRAEVEVTSAVVAEEPTPPPSGAPTEAWPEGMDGAAASQALNALGVDLLLAMAEGGGDVVAVSPAGIAMALGTLAQGASGDAESALLERFGVTDRDQGLAWLNALASILDDARDPAELRQATALWIDDGSVLNPGFADRVSTAIGRSIKTVDLSDPATLREINGWVDGATLGMIPTILDTLPADANVVLGNVIYFADDWRYPFDPARTAPATFTNADGTQSEVPMMFQPGVEVLHGDADGFEVVRLGYQEGRYALEILLPDDENIAAFVHGRAAADLLAAFAATDPVPVSADLRLPRFDVESSTDLIAPLETAGLGALFGDPTLYEDIVAGGMTIAQIAHKVRVAVDEAGTTAAAATAIISTKSIPMPALEITIDRPFLFAIRDTSSDLVLFLGMVARLVS